MSRRLTDDPNLDYNAVLSRDGRWVVFVSERDGTPIFMRQIWLRSLSQFVSLLIPEGTTGPPFRRTELNSHLQYSQWEPGHFLDAFCARDVTAETRAVNLSNNPYGDFNSAFSPDGSRIAFSSNRAIFERWNPLRLIPFASAVPVIYVINTDGSQRLLLNSFATNHSDDLFDCEN